ncbi:retrovirus-related pol polyprotein from transposon TNT 1-94 [Tanacetum coccineum]
MFRINPFKPFREEKYVPNKVRVSVRTNPITVSQPHVITKTRRSQPRSNTKNDRVPSASKSCCSKNKKVEVEEHPKNLLLSKNKKHMSSECNHVKLAIWNDKSKVVCAMCKQCLITANHGAIQICLWCVNSGCSKHMIGNLKLLINFIWKFLGTVHFGNDHVAAILGFGDLQWGNILVTRVYFVEGLRHNLFLVGQFYDSDLEEIAQQTFTPSISMKWPLHLQFASWLVQLLLSHLSYLNFDTINDLAKNDLVTGLLKFKYHKEHLCPSCEQGKSKRASHPPKPVPNSKQRLHLLHMDSCVSMRITSINGKRYVLVIVDDYSCYTWVHFLKSKDEAPEVIKTFLKKITVLLQDPFIMSDRKDIGKLGAKGDIGFFISYSANSCAYRVYNQRTKNIMETMNVTFGELSAIAFEQSSLKPELSTITTQQPTERELDLLFEAMYDDYIGGQPLAAPRTTPAAKAPLVLQTPTTSTTIVDTAPTPTTSSS